MEHLEKLQRIVQAHRHPLMFATISGAHLYGFPSPDSDFDLRGAHILPLPEVLGLDVRHETLETSRVIEGLEMDIVSHDLRKFFQLVGYSEEQSPAGISRSGRGDLEVVPTLGTANDDRVSCVGIGRGEGLNDAEV